MRIAYVTNTDKESGVGVRTDAILRRLRKVDGLEVIHIDLDGRQGTLKVEGKIKKKLFVLPGVLRIKSLGWIRLGGYLRSYLDGEGFDLVHLTNQSLSFLSDTETPTVLTVHDLIELVEPQSGMGGLLSKYLYKNIEKADQLVAVSHYTGKEIVKELDIDESQITIIYNGVGDSFGEIRDFKNTIGYQSLWQDYSLKSEDLIVLYVGSDHARKNVVTALRAFSIAKETLSNLKFIKVGRPGLSSRRALLLKEINKLGLSESVRLVSDISNERLNEIYNLADVLVYPSRFEGFGLPPLQAMAAGCPVITSNLTSLPEVVGDDDVYGELSAVIHDPNDKEGIAEDIVRVVSDRKFSAQLKKKGLARAKTFVWDDAVEELVKVYNKVL